MTHSELSYVQPPHISPLRHALNVLTNRGQLPPELRQIVLDGSALDTEEDESPSTPRLSPLPSPRSPSRRSQSQSTGTRSNGVSPRLGLVSFGRRAVSLARRASASASGGVRKWQAGEKQRRSFSVATALPLTSRGDTATAKQPSLLFSPPDDDPPAPNGPSTGTTTHYLSSPSESIIPLSALDVPLASFPAPSPLMSSPSLSPIADDDNNIAHNIPVAHSAPMADVAVPAVLQMGTPMIKVSGGKQKRVVFRLDPDRGQIIWESKKHRISTSLLLARRRLS
jgi:hypothetical protein